MADPSNLSCYNCGSIGLTDGFDGFFYCLQCGSQADDIIDTGVAEEDLVLRDVGKSGAPIYSQSHTRRRNPTVLKVEPLSQSQSLFGTSQSEFWDSLNLMEDPSGNVGGKDGDIVMLNDGVGPTGPEDFGSGDVLSGKPSFEEYADEVRMRYVMGLQLIMELQCEVLVKEFKATPIICGLAASIWLRFVTATRVFDEDWAFQTVQESESQCLDPERIRRVCSSHKDEPHNFYGQRVVVLWVKSLRKKIPLFSTLAVSFLACHVAREAILPTDIIKWSLEGKLPYYAAFVDIESRIGKTSRACPISSKLMHRPSRISSLQKLESLAASIAHTIGLNLPPVNFHSIACRYLNKLALPVDKILPHACRIYEWSMPPDLWLSTNELRLPSRVCVMSILIIAMRILYNLHGFGEWEKSLSVDCASCFPPHQKTHSSPANNFSNMQADSENRPGFTSHDVDNPSVSPENPHLTTTEFLRKIEARYHEIAETYEYSKDLPTYLQYCKDVAFAGSESLFIDDHDEQKMIEKLWNYYQNEKDYDQTEDVDQNAASNQKRLREGSNDRLSNESKKVKGEEDRISRESLNNRTGSIDSRQSHSSKSLDNSDDDEQSSVDKAASSLTSINEAIRQLKLDMEEKRFCYIPPRINPKRFDYLHYSRKIDEGALTYAAHADYYILLRACARAAQVDIRIMHIGVLSLEKRLSWLEDRIHKSLRLTPTSITCEFCSDVPDHVGSVGLSDLDI
ncbi:TATA box-binding protein-associated factor RNA polymerase I subunit B isoform X2 [Cucumis sativus]|uniref:RRN7-type domain-containing protein n=1 Tax=Cucumis sativus TaxID=3659 RepID=A0A0A0LHI6_CUCSA|nr:TATA box-binding protein-associated factor RNA polymerase I subunit B isoform X2 [Cucumis sativus]